MALSNVISIKKQLHQNKKRTDYSVRNYYCAFNKTTKVPYVCNEFFQIQIIMHEELNELLEAKYAYKIITYIYLVHKIGQPKFDFKLLSSIVLNKFESITSVNFEISK